MDSNGNFDFQRVEKLMNLYYINEDIEDVQKILVQEI
jgi:hypothetical protein